MAPSEEPSWPDGKWHLLIAGAIGTCTRHDDRVGATGMCGEGTLGADFPWHFLLVRNLSVELGIGSTVGATSGNRDYGTSRTSNGPYGTVRVLLGWDLAPLLFLRAGPQVRVTWAQATAAPGVVLVVDTGTRLGRRAEVGLRAFAGADGVIRANAAETRLDTALAFGAAAYARVFF